MRGRAGAPGLTSPPHLSGLAGQGPPHHRELQEVQERPGLEQLEGQMCQSIRLGGSWGELGGSDLTHSFYFLLISFLIGSQ